VPISLTSVRLLTPCELDPAQGATSDVCGEYSCPVWGRPFTYFSELGPYQTGQPRGKFHVPDGAILHGPMGYIVAIADGWAEV